MSEYMGMSQKWIIENEKNLVASKVGREIGLMIAVTDLKEALYIEVGKPLIEGFLQIIIFLKKLFKL